MVTWWKEPLIANSPYLNTVIIGEEYGEKSGNKHWHGFVQTINRFTFKRLKKVLGQPHIEKMRDNPLACVKYSLKSGKCFAFYWSHKTSLREDDRLSLFKFLRKFKLPPLKFHNAQDPKIVQITQATSCKSQEEEESCQIPLSKENSKVQDS